MYLLHGRNQIVKWVRRRYKSTSEASEQKCFLMGVREGVTVL